MSERISTRIFAIVAAVAALGTASPVVAQGMTRVTKKADFIRLVSGRELQQFGIGLTVSPGGAISGSAFGTTVSGSWVWQDGFFCRDLAYARTRIERNCQLVQSDGRVVRFTADRGKGDSADLRLR